MSSHTTRGSTTKAALVDMANGTVSTRLRAPVKSKTPSERSITARRLPRAERSKSTPQTSLAVGSLIPTDSVGKVENSDGTELNTESVVTPANVGRKRKRSVHPDIKQVQDREVYEDLPHNMGRVKRGKEIYTEDIDKSQAKPSVRIRASPQGPVKEKESEMEEATKVAEAVNDNGNATSNKSTPRKKSARADKTTPTSDKKVKTPSKKDTYGITEGISPFPNYPRPTSEECYQVADILRKAHPHCHPRPKTIPEPSQIIAGCGEVPSVLDAMIRTLLSAATNGRNSSNAYQGMVKRYGNRETGVGKGSVDYNAVRLAPQADLEKAIASGGLAKNKSKNIKAILDMVYEENQERRKDLLAARAAGDNKKKLSIGKGLQESEEQKDAEIALAEQNNLSLDHLYYLPTYVAIAKFTTYPGIGVKTAACVSLFCMQRDCFAVDTHVFRLCKLLGWVPDQSAADYIKAKGEPRVDRDPTFSHLEVRIPDELKYDLHQLFIAHGKKCPRCKGGATANSAGWEKGCPLEELIDRKRLAKGGSLVVKRTAKLAGKAVKKGKKAAVRDDELDGDEDVEMSDLVDDEDDDEIEQVMPDLHDDEEYKSPLRSKGTRKSSSRRK